MNEILDESSKMQLSATRNLISKQCLSERVREMNEEEGIQEASISVHRIKQFGAVLDDDLQEIPMRRGESVDLEQINDTSKVNSFPKENIRDNTSRYQVIDQQIILQDQILQKDESNSQSKSSSVTQNSFSKKYEFDQEKVEQLEQVRMRMISFKHQQNREFSPSCSHKIHLSFKVLIALKAFFRRISTNLRIFYRMTELQHQFIGDNSTTFKRNSSLNSFPRLQKIVNILEIMQTNWIILLSKIPMFSPYNVLRLIWDCFIAFLTLSIIFILSIVVFFSMEEDYLQGYFQFCFVIFTFNVLVYLNTGVVVRGKLTFDRLVIAKHYLKQMFLLDQIGMIPLYLQVVNCHIESRSILQILNLLILTKLYEYLKIVERVTYILNYQKNMKNIIDLVRLVFIIGCVCHIFCLFWYGLAVYEISIGKKDTWLHAKNLTTESSILIKYVYSFYYLSVTMITVGYGDIVPQNPIEMTFTILTMFVTGFFWAYSLNRIGKIISNTEMQDKTYKESMQIIHAFMREEKVDSELRAKVSNYLKYYYKESNEVQKNQECGIINQLSDQLKSDLMENVKGKYLHQIPFIAQMGSQNQLISIMKEMLFSPGEYIFHQDDLSDCSLFYLVKGEVEIIIEREKISQAPIQFNGSTQFPIIIKTLEKLNYFGELSFITGNRRCASVRATDFCRVYKIERQKFLEILKKNSSDYESFCMLQEGVVMKKNYSLVKQKCYACDGVSHLISECPKIHLTVSKNILAIKAFKQTPHLNRQKMPRREKKLNSFHIAEQCLSDAYRFLNNEMFNENSEASQFDDEDNDDDQQDAPSNLEQLIEEYQSEQSNNISTKKYTSSNSQWGKTSQFNPKKSINLTEENRLNGSSHTSENGDCSMVDSILHQQQQQQITQQQQQQQSEDYSSFNCKGSLIAPIPAFTDIDSQNFSDYNQAFQKINNSQYTERQKAPQNLADECGKQQQQILIKSSFDQMESLKSFNVQQDEKPIIDVNQYHDLNKIIHYPMKPTVINSISPMHISINLHSNNKKKSTIIKQVSFKHEDNSYKVPSYNSENVIPSSECIQPLQIQQSKVIDSSFKMQNSLNESHSKDSSILEPTGSCNSSGTNKIVAQAYFRQIKSKSITNQMKRVQKQITNSINATNNNFNINNSNSGNIITMNTSSQKVHQQDPIRILSNINGIDEPKKKPTIIIEGKGKSTFDDSMRKSVLDDQHRKSIIEDMQKRKKHKETFIITSIAALDQKLEEMTTNKKQINSDVFLPEFHNHNLQTKTLEIPNSRTIIPNQDSHKMIQLQHYLHSIEWDYLQLILFDKAKLFEYYHPQFNYTQVIQKIKKLQSKKDIKSKMTIRGCLLNGHRRSPVFEKYTSPSHIIIKKNLNNL